MGIESLHPAALFPALILLLIGPAKVPLGYRLVAASFIMSWTSDAVSHVTGSWAGDYVVVPIQTGLVLAAVVDKSHRLLALATLAALSILSFTTFPGPTVLVMAMGSAGAVLLARGALRWPIYSYYGFGTLFFLLGVRNNFAQWFEYEAAYQVSRMGAFVLFVALAVGGRSHAIRA